MKIKELKKAAVNFGTPIYVYDLSIIESQNRKLQNAFKNHFEVFYFDFQ